MWAGIGLSGMTGICIFEGKMDACLYTEILDGILLPFIQSRMPDGHRFMQDNDPKHTSRYAQDFYEEAGVNWWKTPPESPDLNPTENLWHELKEYIRREVMPKKKEELIQGIRRFWCTVSKEGIYCIPPVLSVLPSMLPLRFEDCST